MNKAIELEQFRDLAEADYWLNRQGGSIDHSRETHQYVIQYIASELAPKQIFNGLVEKAYLGGIGTYYIGKLLDKWGFEYDTRN